MQLVAGGDILVLASDAVYLASESEWLVSPLAGAFGETLPEVVVGVDGDLWFRSASGLHLWREGFLYPVVLPTLPTAGALLTFGPLQSGVPALWVAAEASLYSVHEEGEEILGIVVRENFPVDALSADATGRLWALSEGDVHRREVDGTWSWFQLPSVVSSLASDVVEGATWVTTEDAVWLTMNDEWWPAFSESRTVSSFDAIGRAMLVSDAGLLRVRVGTPPEPPEVTWSGDVAPLAEASCGACHGVGQFAHEMASREQWMAEIDDILLVTDSEAMPLPPNEPLTSSEVKLIQAWKDGGFLE